MDCTAQLDFRACVLGPPPTEMSSLLRRLPRSVTDHEDPPPRSRYHHLHRVAHILAPRASVTLWPYETDACRYCGSGPYDPPNRRVPTDVADVADEDRLDGGCPW